MKIKFYISVIAGLILINVLLVLKQSALNSRVENLSYVTHQVHYRDSLVIKNLRNSLIHNFTGVVNELNIPALDSIRDEKVVLYAKEGVCGSCLQELLSYMSQLGEKIGKEKLIFLGNFKNKKNYNTFIRSQNFIDNFVYINDDDIFKDIGIQPIIFVINKKHELIFFYMPNYYTDFKEKYFSDIIPSYFLRNLHLNRKGC